MRELMSIFIPSMILVYLSDRYSTYKTAGYGNKIYIKHNNSFYIVATITMAVYVGLRTWYNDTVTYIQGYNMTSIDNSVFDNINWSFGYNPGFVLIRNVLKYFNVSSQSFLMLFAIVTISLYMWFIRKYTNNLVATVFFFFTMGCYTFTMAAIKQCVAVALCLVAVDCAVKSKWGYFVVFVLLAATFHPYALMYLLIPILMFSPWSRKTYWMISIFLFIGLTLNLLMNTIISITNMLGEDYSIVEFSGAGVNVLRFTVVTVPVLISFAARKNLETCEDKKTNLIINLSILNALIMFVALFGTANYFARLANYFLIFQCVSLPMLFKYFNKGSSKFLFICAVVCYTAYFYYSNAISQPFDAQFDSISIMEYLYIIFD